MKLNWNFQRSDVCVYVIISLGEGRGQKRGVKPFVGEV